jgi:hypothetical protein
MSSFGSIITQSPTSTYIPNLPNQLPSGLPNQPPSGLPNQPPSGLPNQLPSGLPNQLPSGLPNQPPSGLPNLSDIPLPYMPNIPNPQEDPINNPADDYLTTIKTLEEKLPSILDDFKKYYVFFNKNPNYDEYRRIFENLKSNLSEIESDLFNLSNKLDINIIDTSKELLKYNKLIEQERKRNIKLNSKVSQYDNTYNGSKQLITNYKEMYNLNYLKNIFIFLGIILSIVLLLKVFAKKNNITTVSQK